MTDTLGAEGAALASAASAAEEALQLEREALALLRDGWSGDSASAAADFIESHCREGEAVVSALRHAARALGGLDDPAGPVDRAPSSFASPVPQAAPAPAPAPAPAMSWPALPMPALPDIGGAISNLIALVADAADGASVETPVADTPVADTQKPSAPAPPDGHPVAKAVAAEAPAAAPPGPVSPGPVSPGPDANPPLLAAEAPPPEPAERTPCEIAADELPQVGR